MSFKEDVLLESLKVSSFGSGDVADLDIERFGSLASTSTGTTSVGDAFLAAGDVLRVGSEAGSGFSFDAFTVRRAATTALVFGAGLAILARRRAFPRRS